MTIEALIQSTLEEADVPVFFTRFSHSTDGAEPPQYITWMMALEQSELDGDDAEQERGYYVQVNIWSKSNYHILKDNVKTKMLAAGFTQRDDRDGPYSPETHYYNRVQRYFYLEEVI